MERKDNKFAMTYLIGGMYYYVWTIGFYVSLTCFFDKRGKDVHVMGVDPVVCIYPTTISY
jgi:hypothetical protein